MLLAVMLLEAMMLLNPRKKSRKRQVWKMQLICSEVTVVMETTKSIKVLNAIKSVHVSSMHAMDVIDKFLSDGQIHLLVFTSPIKELYTNF